MFLPSPLKPTFKAYFWNSNINLAAFRWPGKSGCCCRDGFIRLKFWSLPREYSLSVKKSYVRIIIFQKVISRRQLFMTNTLITAVFWWVFYFFREVIFFNIKTNEQTAVSLFEFSSFDFFLGRKRVLLLGRFFLLIHFNVMRSTAGKGWWFVRSVLKPFGSSADWWWIRPFFGQTQSTSERVLLCLVIPRSTVAGRPRAGVTQIVSVDIRKLFCRLPRSHRSGAAR